MSDSDLPVLIFCFIGGGIILVSGLAARQGHPRTRGRFMLKPNPLVPVDAVYGSLPIGLGWILVGIGLVLSNAVLTGVGLGVGTILGFVFIIWKPRWMKPDWLLWLEEHYNRPMIDFMFDQVRYDKSWFRQVRTQEELEEWAQRMAEQYERELQQRVGE